MPEKSFGLLRYTCVSKGGFEYTCIQPDGQHEYYFPNKDSGHLTPNRKNGLQNKINQYFEILQCKVRIFSACILLNTFLGNNYRVGIISEGTVIDKKSMDRQDSPPSRYPPCFCLLLLFTGCTASRMQTRLPLKRRGRLSISENRLPRGGRLLFTLPTSRPSRKTVRKPLVDQRRGDLNTLRSRERLLAAENCPRAGTGISVQGG